MTTVHIDGNDLVVTVEGLHKLWALRSRLKVPLDHVRSASPDPEVATRPKGFRTGGTRVPGILTVGSFWWGGEKVFWDVGDAARAVVIELEDEDYSRLVVQVDDPRTTAQLVEAALPHGAH